MAIDEAEPVRRSSGLTPQTRNVELTGPRSLSLPTTNLSPAIIPDSRLARPPRSDQRSPSSSPTDFGTRLPSTTSSEPMRLTRSYNRRDLSEELESPRQSTSTEFASNWSRSSTGNATPKLDSTPTQLSSQFSQGFSSSSRRDIFTGSPILPMEPYQTFNETLPASPSFIPPFQFNGSESSFTPFSNDANYTPSTIVDDLHSPRSQIPISTFPNSSAIIRTSSRSRSGSRQSSVIPAPPSVRSAEEDQDSGSQYSLEGEATSDSEPWGGLIVGESPPRSPILTREHSPLPSSSTMAVLNDFVESEHGSLSAIDQAANGSFSQGDDEVGLALLTSTDRRRSASDGLGNRDLSRQNSNTRAKSVPRREQIQAVVSDKSSAVSGDQTWWKEGGLVVNGKSLGSMQDFNSRDPRTSYDSSEPRSSAPSRSDVDRTISRSSGSSTPRHSIPENPASALRALYTTSAALASRRSPTTEILDPLIPTSRSSSQSTSPTSALFAINSPTSESSPRRSSNSSYNRSPRNQKNVPISETQSGRSSSAASRSRANSTTSGDVESLSRRASLNAASTRIDSQPTNSSTQGTLLFGNISQPPFSFHSPTATTSQALPSMVDLNKSDSFTIRPTQASQSRSPPMIEETLSTFVVPLFAQTAPLTTPGSGKSDKKPLPVLRAKSSRRISAGTMRRAAAMDSHTTIEEDEGNESDRRDSISTPRREDSSQLLSEFSTPLSTSDFADAYFDQSPSRSDVETLYPAPSIPTAYSFERDTNSRQPFRSSLEMNYPEQYSASSPRNYDNLLDPTQPNKRISQSRRPSTEIPTYADGRPLSETSHLMDRGPSALSELISEDGDVFHDAATQRDSWEIQRTVPTSEPGLMESSLAGQSPVKGDAKARARAFVDDLRRARTEAISSVESSVGAPDSPASLFSAQAETPPPQFEPSSSSLSHELADTPSPIPPSPTSSISQPSLGVISSLPLATRFPELEKLNRRRRPLPPCLLSIDIKKAKTPGQKAKVYATKINAIANLDSGVNVWIGFVRGQYNPKPSPPSAFASRSARLDTSTGSNTFPLRQDSYTATEIPYGHFGPQDLTPTVPYPGVLLPVNARYSNSSLKAPSIMGTKANFFSLGRKGSKRTPPSISQPSRSTGYIVNSPLGPLGIKSPMTTTQSLRPSGGVSGPRALNSRQSFDSINSVATSNYQSSFSYGNMRPGGSTVDIHDQLDKLGDILTGVNRDVLHSYLDKAGGDDVLAVSLYLEDEKKRRV